MECQLKSQHNPNPDLIMVYKKVVGCKRFFDTEIVR